MDAHGRSSGFLGSDHDYALNPLDFLAYKAPSAFLGFTFRAHFCPLRKVVEDAVARANRVFLPGLIWHITDRCHERQFLLRARHDRRNWIRWLFEARRRYALCVLNYIVTCNHIHLLVRDRGGGEIAHAMQLIAGRTAQSYNERKARTGAFWQDRYHATAVESDRHLWRCMSYIDLNMVRAGVVSHPAAWRESGYCEIQRLPQRYRVIDMQMLQHLLGLEGPEAVRAQLAARTAQVLAEGTIRREPAWSESLAVGSREYLAQVQQDLGARALGRRLAEANGLCMLREHAAAYKRVSGRNPNG
jgi:putative transposase